jgi:hypothetical protein
VTGAADARAHSTSNVLFPTATANAIYALISSQIKPVGNLGMYGIPCSAIAGLPAQIDITFTDTSGSPFNLTIPTAELNVGPIAGNTAMCQVSSNLVIRAFEADGVQTLINAYDGLSLVGGSLLKHWFSVWNFGDGTMGFAPTGEHVSCTCEQDGLLTSSQRKRTTEG